MSKNIKGLFSKSKTLKDGKIKHHQIAKLIANLPNNDYCYNDLETVVEIDHRDIFRYFKDVIYETNNFNLGYSKFGYYVPNYLRIISLFTSCYSNVCLVLIFNIMTLTRDDLSNVKVS